jgi:hypothetical protein
LAPPVVLVGAGSEGFCVTVVSTVGQLTPRSGSGASGAFGSTSIGSLAGGEGAGGGRAGCGGACALASPETNASPAAAHSSRAARSRETHPLIKQQDLASAPEPRQYILGHCGEEEEKTGGQGDREIATGANLSL